MTKNVRDSVNITYITAWGVNGKKSSSLLVRCIG